MHPDCSNIPNVFSYNVDDLKQVVERNTAKRRREMIEAEIILRDEMGEFVEFTHIIFPTPYSLHHMPYTISTTPCYPHHFTHTTFTHTVLASSHTPFPPHHPLVRHPLILQSHVIVVVIVVIVVVVVIVGKFRLWQQSLGAIPTINKLQEKAEALRSEELRKASAKLSALSAKDLEIVEKVWCVMYGVWCMVYGI